MAYQDAASALREEYYWLDNTFGGTTVTHTILGPRGCVGFVRDILVDVTTSLVGTSTTPEIDIGISSGDSTYGRYILGTAAAGSSVPYGLGSHRASQEPITGNPPRTLADITGHVVLDGGPWGTSGSILGGSSTTTAPLGRIPQSFYTITNATSGGSSKFRLTLKEPLDVNVKVGHVCWVKYVGGSTNANTYNNTILAVSSSLSNPANQNYVEINTAFAGTYTSGGILALTPVVTCAAGSGSQAGGGHVRIYVDWVGQNL